MGEGSPTRRLVDEYTKARGGRAWGLQAHCL